MDFRFIESIFIVYEFIMNRCCFIKRKVKQFIVVKTAQHMCMHISKYLHSYYYAPVCIQVIYLNFKMQS